LPMNGDEQFQVRKDGIRKHLLKYTRKAFRMLPHVDNPRILDIGCGSGFPTLELVKLSRGDVTGIDIDRPALDTFTKAIRAEGLTGRVRAIHCSMFDMDFAEESFDIIWSEGSIYVTGFEKGLQEWKRLLKPGGFMVVHDEQGDVPAKLETISRYSFELLGYFLLSTETWRTDYFVPLEKLVQKYLAQHTGDFKLPEVLHQAQTELDMFRKSPERNSSAYFIMKKQ